MIRFDVLVDPRGSQLHKETGERRASRATVEPKDDGVVLRVVPRLKEP